MSNILVVGDVHAKLAGLTDLIAKVDVSYYDKIIQLGDLGVGYWDDTDLSLATMPSKFKFIRGNHDDPEKCKQSRFFWGDVVAYNNRVLAVGGAFSIDRKFRQEGLDWWPNEELSDTMFEVALAQARAMGDRLELVITHDCPKAVQASMFNMSPREYIPSRTSTWLERLRHVCSPKYWVFGHYHYHSMVEIGRTTFICLGELEAKEFTLDLGVTK